MNLKGLPKSPGIYIFMDNQASILYVGKAKSIALRVRQHFSNDLDSRHISMISQVKTINYIKTDSEADALVLEERLIKKLKPRYNIDLRDGKTYPFLELSLGEDFPQLKITRAKTHKPTSLYYGPFPNVGDVRAAKSVIDKIFPLRKCKRFIKRERACLNYQIGRCLAPCSDNFDNSKYLDAIEKIKLFLSGKHKTLIDILNTSMQKYKKIKDYESAAVIRDQINNLKGIFPMVNIKNISLKTLSALERIDPLLKLQELMNLSNKPQKIQAYDISHTSSKEAVGSAIFFNADQPDKNNYRKFIITQEETSDDLKMLKEVLLRSLQAIIEGRVDKPDIILIDGGRTQGQVACAALKLKKIKDIAMLCFAKYNKKIYYKNRVLDIAPDSETYRYLKQIDEEAHRFAHSFHVKRRSKKDF